MRLLSFIQGLDLNGFIFFPILFSKFSSVAKDLPQNISPAEKIEGRETSDRKEEEEEKREMGPAEEKKEEEDKDSEVKEEKSGTERSRRKEGWKVCESVF